MNNDPIPTPEEEGTVRTEETVPAEGIPEGIDPEERQETPGLSRCGVLCSRLAAVFYALTLLAVAGHAFYWRFSEYQAEIDPRMYFLWGVYLLLAISFMIRRPRFLPAVSSALYIIFYAVIFVPTLITTANENGLASAEFRDYLIYCIFMLVPYAVLLVMTCKALTGAAIPRFVRYLPAIVFFAHMTYCRYDWGYFDGGFSYTIYYLFDLLEAVAILFAGCAVVDADLTSEREKRLLPARIGGGCMLVVAVANVILAGPSIDLGTILSNCLLLFLAFVCFRAEKDYILAVPLAFITFYRIMEFVNHLLGAGQGLALVAVLNFAAFGVLLFIALTHTLPFLQGQKYMREGLWFLPGAFMMIGTVYSWITWEYIYWPGYVWPIMLFDLTEVAGLLLIGYWLRSDEPSEDPAEPDETGDLPASEETGSEPAGGDAETPGSEQ